MSVFGSLLILNSKTQRTIKASESSINQIKVQTDLTCDRIAELEREQDNSDRVTREELEHRLENRCSQITQKLQQHVSDCEQRYSFELQQQLEHQRSSLEGLLLKTTKAEPVVAASINQRPRVLIAIDEANLFYSLRAQGCTPDYQKLLDWLKQNKEADYRTVVYMGIDPKPKNDDQQKFLGKLKSLGCEIVSVELKRFSNGKTKANVDAEIVRTLLQWQDSYDELILASGDGDFASTVSSLIEAGKKVKVAAVRANTAKNLIHAADNNFLNLGNPDLLPMITIFQPKLIPPKVINKSIAA